MVGPLHLWIPNRGSKKLNLNQQLCRSTYLCKFRPMLFKGELYFRLSYSDEVSMFEINEFSIWGQGSFDYQVTAMCQHSAGHVGG